MTVGVKHDQGKARLDLLPPRAIEAVGHVLTHGAQKYAPDNWRRVEGWRWRYAGAALRHLVAWMKGEQLDADSGLPHLAHAMCCLAFILELELEAQDGAKG